MPTCWNKKGDKKGGQLLTIKTFIYRVQLSSNRGQLLTIKTFRKWEQLLKITTI